MDIAAGPTSPLLSIPLEVLLQIVYHLTTPEYGSLRLSCKNLEETLFTSFAREFFTKRQFMMTEFSLQTLVDISNSRFSSSLNHVIFSVEEPSKYTVVAHDFSDAQIEHARRNRLFIECNNFLTFQNTCQDVELLVETFANLPNLEAVGIRDFNSRSRRRDHPQIEWKSYGVSTFEYETGRRLEKSMNSKSRTFVNTLRALGRATVCPSRFEVILRQGGLDDTAFNLPSYLSPILGPVLSNLCSLFLDLGAGSPPIIVAGVGTAVSSCHGYNLREFLSRLDNLEHLRLNFGTFHVGVDNDPDVLSWLSEPVHTMTTTPATTTSTSLLPSTPPPVKFSKLRRLDIGTVLVAPTVLLSILSKYQATLRSISFRRVTLVPTNTTSDEKANLWVPLFGKLSKLNLTLTSMDLSALSQQIRHREWNVSFKGTPDPSAKKWAGNNTQSGLRDYADQVIVNGLDIDTDSEHSDSNSDDDMSMDSDNDDADSDNDADDD